MSGLLFLSSDDFKVMNTQKGSILCTNVPGFCLVLFYSTECVYCQDLIPLFKKIPGNVGGCEFGMINVSNNKKCVIIAAPKKVTAEPSVINLRIIGPIVFISFRFKVNPPSKRIIPIANSTK